MLSFLSKLAIIQLIWNKSDKSPHQNNNGIFNRGKIITNGGDVNFNQTINQGFDTGDSDQVIKYLNLLWGLTLEEKKKKINGWRGKEIKNLNLIDLLIKLTENTNKEFIASREKIDALREKGENELADILEELNKVFESGNIDEFEKKKREALESFDKDAKKSDKVSKKKRENQLNILESSARKYEALFKFESAISDYKEAIKIVEEHFNGKHKNYSLYHNYIGVNYFYSGHYDNHFDLAFYSKGKYDKAIEYFEKALKIDLKFLGNNHPDTAIGYNNLGLAFSSKRKYDKAISLYEKAIDILEKVSGLEDALAGTVYNNLGSAFNSKGEYEKGIEYLEKALKINLKVLGNNHPNVAIRYNNLGGAFYSKGDYEKARNYLILALDIYKKKLAKNHPVYQHVLKILREIDSIKAGEYE